MDLFEKFAGRPAAELELSEHARLLYGLAEACQQETDAFKALNVFIEETTLPQLKKSRKKYADLVDHVNASVRAHYDSQDTLMVYMSKCPALELYETNMAEHFRKVRDAYNELATQIKRAVVLMLLSDVVHVEWVFRSLRIYVKIASFCEVNDAL